MSAGPLISWKNGRKKIIMAGNERAPKKIKSKKGEFKSEKPNFSFLLLTRTYSLDAKQEAWEGPLNEKFP